jgi:hypothetical protein
MDVHVILNEALHGFDEDLLSYIISVVESMSDSERRCIGNIKSSCSFSCICYGQEWNEFIHVYYHIEMVVIKIFNPITLKYISQWNPIFHLIFIQLIYKRLLDRFWLIQTMWVILISPLFDTLYLLLWSPSKS